MDSDDDLRRHCLDDVARPLTCQIVFILSKRCVILLLLPSVLVVPSVWLVTWRCHVVVVVEVVERLREVAGIGGGGDDAEVVDDGGRERKYLFVHDVYASFRQTPLTRLSIKHNGRLHDLLCKFLLSVVSLYIRS